MIRLLGAITGSALALATLLVVIGIPQFKTESSAHESAIVTLPFATNPVDTRDGKSKSPDVGTVIEFPEASVATIADDGAADPVDTLVDDAGTAADHPPDFDSSAWHREPMAPIAVESRPVLDTPQSWYAFWSPFRSELAANGFVARLQSVTGLDYRVVRVKPGVYEVAFAYEDDGDISANLTQITAATGLELPQ